MKASENQFPKIQFTEQSGAIASPTTGDNIIFFSSTDGKAYIKNDTGSDRLLGRDALGDLTTNYTNFETDGTMQAIGTAVCWEDLRVASSQVRLGASAPAFNNGFAGSAAMYTLQFNYTGTSNQIFFEIQMPHAWKIGGTIWPHVHFSPISDTGGVAKTVRWKLDYTWASINGTFGSPNTVNMDKSFTDAQWDHLMAVSAAGIDGTGQGISSMLVCRLYRDTGDGADTYDDLVSLLEFDIHYEVDMLGSREETSK